MVAMQGAAMPEGRMDVCQRLDGRPIPGPLRRERPTALPRLVAHWLAPDPQALGWRVSGRITAASEALHADARPDKRAPVVRRLVPRGAP